MFSALYRKNSIEKLKTTEYDVLVIGGGITGAGIALDCASRGLKVALIEKQDFGAGTSSRSTKLIHGGLRYLKQLEVGLVMEVGREREILHRNCPHLVVPEKMLLPLVKNGTYGALATSFGLWVYDKLAGVKEDEQRIMLSKEETAKQEPLLRQDILEGGGLYIEYRTDDARLTIEVMKTAVRYDANCLNYISAYGFVYNERGRIVATKAKDEITGETFEIQSKTTVNATGPWVDEVRDFDTSNPKTNKYLQLTKGVHLVLPYKRLPLQQSIYFDVPNGRMMFAIPRGEVTYIGTTDTTYKDDIDEPKTSAEDVSYILSSANAMFPTAQLTENDIVSSWAGLRPLIHEDGKSPSEISRKDEIFVSEAWLISIAGGKLTGFRKMAERVTDRVFQRLKKKYQYTEKECFTDKITLSGGDFKSYEAVEGYVETIANELHEFGLGKREANYLVFNYGKDAKQIVQLIGEIGLKDFHPDTGLDMEIVLAKAELWYCFNFELINNLSDFFIRRTGRLYFHRQSIAKLLVPIAETLSDYLDEAVSKEQLIANFEEDYKLVVTFEAENEKYSVKA